MGKTILVTGSNGQLGNEIRQAATTSSRYRYIFTDVQELDITNRSAVHAMMTNQHVDIVINCAAYTQVDRAEDDQGTAELINHQAVRNLATVCEEVSATMIHISTDYVFDGHTSRPYTEQHPPCPIGVYGETKLRGEAAVQECASSHIIIRTSWLYSTFGTNFVKTMQELTAKRDNLKVVFDQIGTPTYAYDLAHAICQIIENGSYVGNKGIYHYSNEGVCSWYDFAMAINHMNNNNCTIAPCYSNEFPSKVKRPHFSVLDKTKIKTTFNLTIPHWMDSLNKYMAIQSHQAW